MTEEISSTQKSARRLSSGAVRAMLSTQAGESTTGHVVQVLDPQLKGSKWQCTLNDGTETTKAAIASQKSEIFSQSGGAETFTIIRVTKWTKIAAVGSEFVYVLDLTVEESGASVGFRLGDMTGAPKTPVVFKEEKDTVVPRVTTETSESSAKTVGGFCATTTPGAGSTRLTPDHHHSTASSPRRASTPRTSQAIQRCDDIASVRTTRINEINPYNHRWVLKARLTSKGDVVEWRNAKGSGQLCKMTFTDQNGDDIETVMFKEAVRKWHPELKEGSVYLLSNGKVKLANKTFSTTSCPYEITLDTSAKIRLAPNDSSIGSTQYTFVTINDLKNVLENETVDVIGILKRYDDVREIQSAKFSKTLLKRDLTLIDEAAIEIRVTLWGEAAKKEPPSIGAIYAFKNIKVGDFGGKSLSALRTTKSSLFFDDNEADETSASPALEQRLTSLKAWWTTGGGESATTTTMASADGAAGGNNGQPLTEAQRKAAFYNGGASSTMLGKSVVERSTCATLKENPNLGRGEKPDYATLKATLSHVKTDKLWYEACPTCRKKVSENPDGTFSCEKCAQTLETCERRYLLNAVVLDDTNSVWVSAFSDTASAIFAGKSADDLAALRDENETEFEDFVDACKHTQFLLRCRLKHETWNDVSRLKTSLVSCAPVDFKLESTALLEAIKLL